MDILVSGSTGLVGRNLCAFLRSKGCRVIELTRKKKNSAFSIYWNQEADKANLEDFEGFDAVIHLAGENIGTGLWTASKKQRILESRKKGTEQLVSLIQKLNTPPRVFISASAVGYYGTHALQADETAPLGGGFLAQVCKEWEAAAKPLEALGIRTVQTRFGTILSPEGGMLKVLVPVFRLGLGGKMGSGEQIISWVSLDDVLGAIFHILTHDSLRGPVNVVSPEPVSQAVFAKTLAKVLSRPCFFSLPRFLFIGEKAKELIFSSIEATASKLKRTGYVFACPSLEGALRFLLQKSVL